ncbi:hypothetical protein FQA47_000502 [Oryzias melastigma]|uniref:Uncharacterized protein n=1 Tax=Oryzias melastigma TaxID=30732 RepID=A0A834F3B4_ORYME|nr:hypothetical protein FQA47_000502 [Oryzias melastigma]
MAVTAAHLTDNTRRVSSGKVDRAAFTRMGGMTPPRAVDAYASRAEAEPTGRSGNVRAGMRGPLLCIKTRRFERQITESPSPDPVTETCAAAEQSPDQ